MKTIFEVPIRPQMFTQDTSPFIYRTKQNTLLTRYLLTRLRNIFSISWAKVPYLTGRVFRAEPSAARTPIDGAA